MSIWRVLTFIQVPKRTIKKIMANCPDLWGNVERIEVVCKETHVEDFRHGGNKVQGEITIAKANIKEIHTTLFLADDK